jgi:hypothetical protein
VILEALSKHMHEGARNGQKPVDVLHAWLEDVLHFPGRYDHQVSRVIHTEIALLRVNGAVGFEGRSETGRILLDSMYEYCQSYENWQFTRWLHELRATDFQV